VYIGEEILWNRPFSQLSDLRNLDLDLDRSHGIPSCSFSSYRSNVLQIGKNYVDGRTGGRTAIHIETGFIRSARMSRSKCT